MYELKNETRPAKVESDAGKPTPSLDGHTLPADHRGKLDECNNAVKAECSQPMEALSKPLANRMKGS